MKILKLIKGIEVIPNAVIFPIDGSTTREDIEGYLLQTRHIAVFKKHRSLEQYRDAVLSMLTGYRKQQALYPMLPVSTYREASKYSLIISL